MLCLRNTLKGQTETNLKTISFNWGGHLTYVLSHINCFRHHLNQLANWAKPASYYFIQFAFSVSNNAVLLSVMPVCYLPLNPLEL